MPYDDGVAQRIRECLEGCSGVVEKKMFGGIAFMLNGNMCCGVVRDVLMVRVGKDNYAAMLGQPHAREMDFTGKPLAGFVYVEPEGFEDDADLAVWVRRGVEFAATLPPKKNRDSAI
jgi:TfoX/Sxy family transcriptional regulator of competence genes